MSDLVAALNELPADPWATDHPREDLAAVIASVDAEGRAAQRRELLHEDAIAYHSLSHNQGATMTIDKATAKELRKPFPPESVGKLPKGGTMLDYVGHAAVTDRLLTVDPEWSWEPFALTEEGLPALDRAGNLWIRLTIRGVTRIGVGDGKNAKECIGDALRNAAMRFGVALDLWAKENLVEFAQAANAPAPPPLEESHPEPAPSEPLLLNTSSRLAKAMYASINEAGIPEAERIAWLGNVVGREITSSKELTEDEARGVLDHLGKRGAA